MSESINCTLCSVTLYEGASKRGNASHQREYNSIFTSTQALQVTQKVAANKFAAICRTFNRKWHPQAMKNIYITTFSLENWNSLSEEENSKHAIRNCPAFSEIFTAFSTAFPTPKRTVKKLSFHHKNLPT